MLVVLRVEWVVGGLYECPLVGFHAASGPLQLQGFVFSYNLPQVLSGRHASPVTLLAAVISHATCAHYISRIEAQKKKKPQTIKQLTF